MEISDLHSDNLSCYYNACLAWTGGKLQRSGTVPGIGLVHAPFSLLPSPFPRQAFSQAIELAPLFNLLADRVSQDAEFLQQTLARYLISTLQKKRSWIPLRATYFLLHWLLLWRVVDFWGLGSAISIFSGKFCHAVNGYAEPAKFFCHLPCASFLRVTGQGRQITS